MRVGQRPSHPRQRPVAQTHVHVSLCPLTSTHVHAHRWLPAVGHAAQDHRHAAVAVGAPRGGDWRVGVGGRGSTLPACAAIAAAVGRGGAARGACVPASAWPLRQRYIHTPCRGGCCSGRVPVPVRPLSFHTHPPTHPNRMHVRRASDVGSMRPDFVSFGLRSRALAPALAPQL
jgi:hypothetical protein